MRRKEIVCDICGREMGVHDRRSTVTIASVPAYRGCDKSTWDLCPRCALWLKDMLTGESDGRTECK